MTSFGENRLTVYGRIIGQVRVLALDHGSALFPRLSFKLSVTLQEHPNGQFSDGRPIQTFEMRDLHGELRLQETSAALGLLHWAGPRRHVRSAPYVSENQIEVVCELDWTRLERLEDHRAGGEAVLWLALWPLLADGHGFLDCEIPPIRASVPRDHWLKLLDSLTSGHTSLLEVVHPNAAGPEFDAALGHIREAKARIARGDYDEAVAACRRAIESICAALNIPNEPAAIGTALEAITDAKRAKAYAGIISRLKELANFTIHRPEAPGRYGRAEAIFAVGATQQCLGLLATLLRERRPSGDGA
ncbi:MAG TPA: hypothetical protein VGA37_06260 [Gemmatimonadales bacterium]